MGFHVDFTADLYYMSVIVLCLLQWSLVIINAFSYQLFTVLESRIDWVSFVYRFGRFKHKLPRRHCWCAWVKDNLKWDILGMGSEKIYFNHCYYVDFRLVDILIVVVWMIIYLYVCSVNICIWTYVLAINNSSDWCLYECMLGNRNSADEMFTQQERIVSSISNCCFSRHLF